MAQTCWSSTRVLLVAGSFLIAVQSFLLYKFNHTVSTPYMDEIFHVRQTQVYCKGEYSTWDNKITTLPGL